MLSQTQQNRATTLMYRLNTKGKPEKTGQVKKQMHSYHGTTSRRSSKSLHTILGHQGIIRSAQINEPIPLPCFPQQNCCSMKRVAHHRRPSVRHQIRPHAHPHVPQFRKQGLAPHELGHVQPLLRRSLQVQVNHVLVPRVVQSPQGPLQALPIAHRTGDEIRQSRNRVIQGRGHLQLGLDEHRKLCLHMGTAEELGRIRMRSSSRGGEDGEEDEQSGERQRRGEKQEPLPFLVGLSGSVHGRERSGTFRRSRTSSRTRNCATRLPFLTLGLWEDRKWVVGLLHHHRHRHRR